MDKDVLSAALYKKVCAEQQQYRKWLLSLPPAEILNHAYEYSVREDIVMSMEDDHRLTCRQMSALLKSPAPLADIYKRWQNQETGHMEDICETVICQADEMLRDAEDRLQAISCSSGAGTTA